jgi:hypothetical protein
MNPRHAAALAILLVGSNAFAFTGEQYLPQAEVPLQRARKLALKAYPGKIISEELEEESGGSGLRYSFVIRHDSAKHEVGIDAKTGRVLENSVEGGHPDSRRTTPELFRTSQVGGRVAGVRVRRGFGFAT